MICSVQLLTNRDAMAAAEEDSLPLVKIFHPVKRVKENQQSGRYRQYYQEYKISIDQVK